MPRYKPADRSPRPLPVVLPEQIQSGTFEFSLDHLVDHELNLAALDARLNNDETGASAYNPRVMLKVGGAPWVCQVDGVCRPKTVCEALHKRLL